MASQIVVESKEQFRVGDGDGEEEDDGEETLDPRVKVRLSFSYIAYLLWWGATPCKFSFLMHYSFLSSVC